MNIFKMNLLNWLISLFMVISTCGAMVTLVTVSSVDAATLDDSCNSGFLGFPSWYRGLTKPYKLSDPNSCKILSPNNSRVGGISNFIWRVALNVVEIIVVAATYLSGFYFLYGGWLFIISQGKPESAAKARSIMTMAALGLVLLLSAVTLMNFIFDKVINITP